MSHPRGEEQAFILASASPRRMEILETLGIEHQVRPAQVDESPFADEPARAHVERLARDKAAAVARERPDAWVLAGDTVVTLEGEILGKPRDGEDAVRMLLYLEGRDHWVLSGLALARPAGRGPSPDVRHRLLSGVEVTRVRFRSFGSATARAYADTGEALGKAGGYAIQGRGAALVESISGDYSCVVGLPVPLLVRLLEEAGRPYRF